VTQPDFVPAQVTDRVRASTILPAPAPWFLDRPAEQTDLRHPTGPRLGSTGPDLGYGLKLARLMEHRLVLGEGEHTEDVIAGCFACGCRRAAHFGRAPVIYDMEWAYGLWGYLDPAPADVVAWRRSLFRGVAEHYWDQRGIVDAVRPETLALTPAQARERPASWRELLFV